MIVCSKCSISAPRWLRRRYGHENSEENREKWAQIGLDQVWRVAETVFSVLYPLGSRGVKFQPKPRRVKFRLSRASIWHMCSQQRPNVSQTCARIFLQSPNGNNFLRHTWTAQKWCNSNHPSPPKIEKSSELSNFRANFASVQWTLNHIWWSIINLI